MRVFVLRARAAPTKSDLLLEGLGGDAHTEVIAHTMMNAMFVAQSHREDVLLYLVLESTQDFSRTICCDISQMKDVGGFHEQALIAKVSKALDASVGMQKEQMKQVEPGLSVETLSFERLIQRLAEDYPLFMMDKKGTPIRLQDFGEDACFILTDHIPMPKKAFNSLKRLGCQKISLGPTMLFASQCVTLIHNELDCR